MSKRETKAERLTSARHCAWCGGAIPPGQGATILRKGKMLLVHRSSDDCLPLFGGGQGRTPEEVEGNATAGGILAMALIGFLMMVIAIGWAEHRHNGLMTETQRTEQRDADHGR
jgi:ribosomal protein L24E